MFSAKAIFIVFIETEKFGIIVTNFGPELLAYGLCFRTARLIALYSKEAYDQWAKPDGEGCKAYLLLNLLLSYEVLWPPCLPQFSVLHSTHPGENKPLVLSEKFVCVGHPWDFITTPKAITQNNLWWYRWLIMVFQLLCLLIKGIILVLNYTL